MKERNSKENEEDEKRGENEEERGEEKGGKGVYLAVVARSRQYLVPKVPRGYDPGCDGRVLPPGWNGAATPVGGSVAAGVGGRAVEIGDGGLPGGDKEEEDEEEDVNRRDDQEEGGDAHDAGLAVDRPVHQGGRGEELEYAHDDHRHDVPVCEKVRARLDLLVAAVRDCPDDQPRTDKSRDDPKCLPSPDRSDPRVRIVLCGSPTPKGMRQGRGVTGGERRGDSGA